MFSSRMLSGGLMIGFVVATTLACSSSDSSTPSPGADAGSDAQDLPAPSKDRVGCNQDTYTERLPTLAPIEATYSKDTATSYLLAAIEARYPFGKELIDAGLERPLEEGSCVEVYLVNRDSAEGVLQDGPSVVHECGHHYDIGEKIQPSTNAYFIRDDLSFRCTGGDTTERAGKTFARSRLSADTYFEKRKPCVGDATRGCDFYASIYLNGDPEDDVFESGDQGYNMLLEEAVQYVNSLATALAVEDSYGRTRAGHRDGILTFLWYIERYLFLARTKYPEAYQAISTDPCWRQLTLTIWDRAWFYLRATETKKSLGIDSDSVLALVRAPELVAEIDALRRLECE